MHVHALPVVAPAFAAYDSGPITQCRVVIVWEASVDGFAGCNDREVVLVADKIGIMFCLAATFFVARLVYRDGALLSARQRPFYDVRARCN